MIYEIINLEGDVFFTGVNGSQLFNLIPAGSRMLSESDAKAICKKKFTEPRSIYKTLKGEYLIIKQIQNEKE